MQTSSEKPVRINKYLADKYKINRREADALIKEKKIFVNGVLALLGTKILSTDVVDYKFRGKHL